jgi:ABC-2 type transport system permease protein
MTELLKIAKAERFKDIIGYFQIVFSILLFTSYYFMPRMADSDMFMNFSIQTVSWIRFTPSYWLASCWYWIEPSKAVLAGTAWYSIVAVVAPF